ncbi:MAG TPA: hypothetical protein P5246_07285 [Candidatus Omnitrophota bacterium]|nr:hypothetical protein [Candidatus Omnitrophota bacterium]HSA31853.1 hypothetical protein [Candidatus Omnitrophota bacterium]
MFSQRSKFSYLVEWFVVISILGLMTGTGLKFFSQAIQRARSVEAITNISNISSALERCYMMRGAYAACQGGYFLKGEWPLDIEYPGDHPQAKFDYGIWADHTDWVIVARPSDQDQPAKDFLFMSTYFGHNLITCGFGISNEKCNEIRYIVR